MRRGLRPVRARRNTNVRVSAEFIETAVKVVYAMLDNTFSLRKTSVWSNLQRETKMDFARDAVVKMIGYLQDVQQAPRMNNESIPVPAKQMSEKSAFALQIKEIMKDGRYRSTQIIDGAPYTFPIVEGSRTFTFTLWDEAQKAVEDALLGSQIPAMSFTGGDDLFSDDMMGIPVSQRVEQARQEEQEESEEDLYVRRLEGPKVSEIVYKQSEEDFYQAQLDGLLTTWLSGDYQISPKELKWFREQMNQPNLTEAKLKADRLTMAKALILHGERMNFLQKDQLEWTQDESLIYNYLRRTLGPKKVTSAAGKEQNNWTWNWFDSLTIELKDRISTKMVGYVWSWNVSPSVKRARYPGQKLSKDVLPTRDGKQYFRIPTPVYDLYLGGYHGPFASGEACPSCKKIKILIGIGQEDFEKLLNRFYQDESEWIREQE